MTNKQHTLMVREFDSETLAGPGYNIMDGEDCVAEVNANAFQDVRATAYLLAAAPILLEAMKVAEIESGSQRFLNGLIALQAAIAQAEGKEGA